jgi:hypothetical protein
MSGINDPYFLIVINGGRGWDLGHRWSFDLR